MVLAIISYFGALILFVHGWDDEAIAAADKLNDNTLSARDKVPARKIVLAKLCKCSLYAITFLVLCNWFGIPVFGGSDDDAPGAQKLDVVLDITPMATPADAQVEPLAFNEWLHAQPDRADDPSIIKWLDRANAAAEDELDIAYAKPYRIVSIESFPSNDTNNRYRLYVHAPEAETALQRAQTAIKSALTYRANYYKRRKHSGAKAWEIEVWLVASAKKTSTYAAWLSYYREGKTAFGETAGYIMDVRALDLPYSQMVDGENYFADMNRYLLLHRPAQ